MQLHEDISSLKQDVTQLKEEMKNVQNQNSGLQCTVDQVGYIYIIIISMTLYHHV